MNIEKKRLKEQEMVREMIMLYCRKNHPNDGKESLCSSCLALMDYATQRSANCPFMEQKTFCSNCKVHCYKPVMREEIRKVMRFSGPRMILHHPVMAVWHVISSMTEKRKQKIEGIKKNA